MVEEGITFSDNYNAKGKKIRGERERERGGGERERERAKEGLRKSGVPLLGGTGRWVRVAIRVNLLFFSTLLTLLETKWRNQSF